MQPERFTVSWKKSASFLYRVLISSLDLIRPIQDEIMTKNMRTRWRAEWMIGERKKDITPTKCENL